MTPNSRPILFSAPMVRALLAGRKTQTRRKLKPQHCLAPSMQTPEWAATHCPYGGHGDQLWVREAWRVTKSYDSFDAAKIWIASGGDMASCIHYEADGAKPIWAGRYRHARFMPRWASRITLEIESVSVERLHEISLKDAQAEAPPPCDTKRMFGSYVACYRELWEEINGHGSWALNPWVWKISFRRMK